MIRGRTLEQLLDEETRAAIGLTKKVRLRLARWIDRHGRDWEPTARYMAVYSTYTNSIARLLKAGIDLDERSRQRISEMSEEELRDAISQILESRDRMHAADIKI